MLQVRVCVRAFVRVCLWLCVCPGVHARVREVLGLPEGWDSQPPRDGQFKANLAQLPDVDKIAAIELTFHDTGEPCGM